MKDKRAFQALMIMVGAGVILFGLVITRAYIATSASNENGTSASVTTRENLVLSYTDCASTKVEDCANIAAELSPGDSVEKTFTIKNDSGYDMDYTLYFQELYNTFVNGDLVYKIENMNTGEVLVEETAIPTFASLTKDQVALAKKIEKDSTEELKMTITFLNRDYSQNENIDAEFEIKMSIEKSSKNAIEVIKAKANSGTPNFANVANTDEGVYVMEDNYGDSYYFRGAVTNNYVNFAGFYWRIIRINGDGSVRMIYDGTNAHANGESSTDRSALTEISWNTDNYNDAKYVGYMYGGTNGEASTSKEQAQTNETGSNAKTQLEEWYKTNIEDKGYSQYLADVIFCNDRSTASTAGAWWTSDTTKGFGTNVTAYGVYERFYNASTGSWDRSDPTPTFICPTNSTVSNNNDWFTAEATTENKGNGDLDYPIGLITLDELATAGGKIHLSDGSTDNSNYYLYKGHWYWSLSPSHLRTGGDASVFGGSLSSAHVTYAGAVAPVINLDAEYAKTLIGTGTMTDPYRDASDTI